VAAIGVRVLGLVVAVVYRFTYSRTVWSYEAAWVAFGFGALFLILRMVGTERTWTLLWKVTVMGVSGLCFLVLAIEMLDGSYIWLSRISYGYEIALRQRGMVSVAGVASLLLGWLWWRERRN